MLSLIKPQGLSFEDVKNYRYNTASSIVLPSSKILIGTSGKIDDASLYESGDLTFDFSNGVAENGLDSGTEASNQWYALYAVPKAGTKQYQLRASIQPPHQAGGTGPVGFSKYRYLGLFRNGVNTYSAISDHLPSDICIFVKSKNIINFTGFNSNNGGLYPQAPRNYGVTLYVANTSINTLLVDIGNANYVGFSGNSPAGGAKVPYRTGVYGFKHYINGSGNGVVAVLDGNDNDRNYHGLVTDTVVNAMTLYFEIEFSTGIYATRLYSYQNVNANVNRGLLLQRYVDPFTIGGI